MEKKRFFDKKRRFLIGNILKGFVAFVIFLVLLYLFRVNFSEADRFAWAEPLYDRPHLIMGIFVASEILFGIIPPELFMIWAMQTSYLGSYFFSITILSLISYIAGAGNYFLGRFLKDKFQSYYNKSKLLRKYSNLFAEHGGNLVIVAAISPLPFSLIALLSGAGGLSKRKYFLNSLFRFLRYFVYAYLLLNFET
jgi:membrane protein YqaA with SNARE-associated domain